MESRRPQGASDRQGFSILELMIALLALSLIATVSVWCYFSRPEVTLVNAAELLVEDLESARQRATLVHEPVLVVFALDGAGYQAFDGTLPGAIRPIAAVERRYDADAVFEGIRVTAVRGVEDRRVRFDRDGHSAREVEIELAYRGEHRHVVVPAGAGPVRLLGASPEPEHEPDVAQDRR